MKKIITIFLTMLMFISFSWISSVSVVKGMNMNSTAKNIFNGGTQKEVVYAFWPNWINTKSYEPDWGVLDYVCYSGLELQNDGTFSLVNPDLAAEVRKKAKDHNIKYTLNIGCSGDVTPNKLNTILENNLSTLIDNLNYQLEAYKTDIDGVCIDLEGISNDNKNALKTIVKAVNDELNSGFTRKYHISMCVPGYLKDGSGLFSKKVNIAYLNSDLNSYLDAIFLMGYDYHGVTSATTGAVSPYDDPNQYDVTDAVNVLSKYYPLDKIILGLPLYGCKWLVKTEPDDAQPSTPVSDIKQSKAIDFKDAAHDAKIYGRLWDDNSNTPWYKYQSDGNWYQGWYDDEESLGIKIDYAVDSGLLGFGFWALGYEGSKSSKTWEAIWDMTEEKKGTLSSSPPSAPQNLTATAGDSQIALTWQVPSSNGGASITNYKIYRGTSSNNETYLTEVSGSTTTYTDTGLTNGTTYYYKVTAVNSVGESGFSNEVSKTPTAPGIVNVKATLDGQPWEGSLNYSVTGPNNKNGPIVPYTFSDMAVGDYILNYASGGPSDATLSSITPSATQTLSPNGSITFTLNFNTSCYRLDVKTSPENVTNISGSGCYSKGEVVTLTAPDTVGDYEFYKWELDGFHQNTSTTINVTMDKPHTAVAYYRSSQSKTITIYADYDTFITNQHPDTQYGSSSQLDIYDGVYNGNLIISDGLLHFDLSSIPANADIESAELWIYSQHYYNLGPNTVSQNLSIYPVNSKWYDFYTWNDKPSYSTNSSAMLASISRNANPGDNDTHFFWKWTDSRLTSKVRSWYNNPSANYGIVLHGDEQRNVDFVFSSTEDSSHKPKLLITYTAPQTDFTYSFDSSPRNNYIKINVDGSSYYGSQLPKLFTWPDGSTHNVNVDSTVNGDTGTKYIFSEWSDGSTSTSRNITAQADSNLTATYYTQHYLTVETEPQGITSISGAGWYNDGVNAVTGIAPDTVSYNGNIYKFVSWKVDGNPVSGNPINISMDVPHTATAVYELVTLDHFEFNTIPNQTSGTPFNITITAIDQYGDTYTNFNSAVTLSVNKGSITPTTTSNFINGVLSNFQVTIPDANTGVIITATCSGKTGSSNSFDVAQAMVKPSVTTNSAANVTSSSAKLNGTLTDMGGASSVTVYFEWGTDTNYGHETIHQTQSSIGAFSASLTNLSPNTTYHFRAVAVNSAGTFYGPDETFATAQAPDFIVSVPLSSQTVTQGGQTTYSVSLTAQNGFSSSVSLSASGLPSGANYLFNPSSVTPTGSSTLTVTTSSSTPTGTYTITITATGGGKTHQTTVTLTVNQAATPPSAPQNLTATAGDSQIALTWQVPSSNGGASITNYKIYRGTSSNNETYLTEVSGSTTTYTDTGLTNGTTYYYKVTAVNSVGESGFSNEVSKTPLSPLTITTASLPNGTVGTAYSATLQASGGTGTYTWSIDSGNLPDGLTLNTSTGEITGTPTTANTYNFTVQLSDGTQTATKDLSIAITSSSPSITLTQPNGGETLTAGSAYTIKWTSSNLSSGRIRILFFDGSQWSFVASDLPLTQTSYDWTVPNVNSSNCKIRVGTYNTSNNAWILHDNSDSTFTVNGSSSSPSITLTQPNGGETLTAGSAYTIKWTSSNLSSGRIRILFFDGSQWSFVASDLPLTQTSYDWTVPNVNSSNCKIRVGTYNTSNNAWILHDNSDSTFTVTP